MATLPDPRLAPQDVARIVADKNKIFQPDGPRIPGLPEYANKPSHATPANMKLLLEELGRYTDVVQAAADQEGLAEDAVQSQWMNDMANWRARLAHYYDVLRSVDPAQAETLVGTDAIYFPVTSPLLDGYFYEALPGIMLDDTERERMKGTHPHPPWEPTAVSNKKPPDVYVPFSLGNQVLEYRQHQKEKWDKFWEDILAGLKGIPKAIGDIGWSVAPWLVGLGVALASATFAGLVIYGIVMYKRPRMFAATPRALPPTQAPVAGVIQS